MPWSWDNIDWTATAACAAWAQAVGTVLAIVGATTVANRQNREALAREDRERQARQLERQAKIEAYLVGARAAADHAVSVLEWLNATCGGMRAVNRMTLGVFGATGNLRAAEDTLAAMPLYLAPSAATAGALVVLAEQLRLARQGIESFLGMSAETMSAEYDQHVAKAKDAAAELTREYMRLAPAQPPGAIE